jgi:hypothetical protein
LSYFLQIRAAHDKAHGVEVEEVVEEKKINIIKYKEKKHI